MFLTVAFGNPYEEKKIVTVKVWGDSRKRKGSTTQMRSLVKTV